jgi:hypothetical protein
MHPAEGSTRPRPTLLFVAAALLLFARVASGVYETRHPPRWPDLVRWLPIAQVSETDRNRPVLYDFSSSACEPCSRMLQDVFGQEEAARSINESFIAVRVSDDDASPEAQALRERFSIDAYPSLIVVGGGLPEPMFLRGYPGENATHEFLRSAIVKSASIRFGLTVGR